MLWRREAIEEHQLVGWICSKAKISKSRRGYLGALCFVKNLSPKPVELGLSPIKIALKHFDLCQRVRLQLLAARLPFAIDLLERARHLIF